MTMKRVFHSAAASLWGRWFTGESPAVRWRVSRQPKQHIFSTGYSKLDRALEIGGLPQGGMTELVGPNPTGTMTIAAAIAAKFQRKQLAVAIVDIAKTFDRELLVRCGLVAPQLLYHTPDTLFDLVQLLNSAGREPGLVVVNFGFSPFTLREIPPPSRPSVLKRLVHVARRSQRAFLYLSQLEDGDPLLHTNYPPGFSLAEVVDLRLWLQEEGWIRSRGLVSGYRGNVTTVKNTFGGGGKGAVLRVSFIDPLAEQLKDDFRF